jgi:hypothetical protein
VKFFSWISRTIIMMIIIIIIAIIIICEYCSEVVGSWSTEWHGDSVFALHPEAGWWWCPWHTLCVFRNMNILQYFLIVKLR